MEYKWYCPRCHQRGTIPGKYSRTDALNRMSTEHDRNCRGVPTLGVVEDEEEVQLSEGDWRCFLGGTESDLPR